MQKKTPFLPLLAVLILLVGTSGFTQSQTPEGRFFSQTGHWVTGEFLNYYGSVPDSLFVFGYPITEAFEDPMKPGTQVQYFQRARFEYNPSAPAGSRIQLAPLGVWLYDENHKGDLADMPTNTGGCRIFAGSNIPVCLSFLRFYDAHDGARLFGQPISEVEIVDGRSMQYFERARIEFRPEKPLGQQVGLADLGRMDFDRRIGDSSRLAPSSSMPSIIQSEMLEIKVRAFASQPLIPAGGNQTISIIIQDQYLRPVANANVIVTVRLPDGRVENYRPGATNADGITQVRFTAASGTPGQVAEVNVNAEVVNGPKASGATWFRLWW